MWDKFQAGMNLVHEYFGHVQGSLEIPGHTQPCVTFIGNRGSGKTENLKTATLDVAKDGRCALVGFDLPGSYAKDMVGHLAVNGLLGRTWYEPVRMTDKVLSWPFYSHSSATGLDLIRDHEISVEEFTQVFWAIRHEKSGVQKPYTKKYMDAAVNVWASLPVRIPPNLILKLFDLHAPERGWMLNETKNQKAAGIFRDVERRAVGPRGAIQYEAETGASERLMSILESPPLWTRDGNSWDWTESLLRKDLVFFDLSGVKEEVARAITINGCNAILNACRRYFERTSKALPVVVVLEECGKLDTITPLILDGMRAWRKAGFSVWPVTQTVKDFKDENVMEELLALCDVHRWHRMNSGIDRAARDLHDATFDPMKEHYRRTRQVHDGYTAIKTVSKGGGKGSSIEKIDGVTGDREREDERESWNEGITYQPKYKEVEDISYAGPQLQEQEWATKLANLTFDSWVRDRTGVYFKQGTMLGDPWPLDLTPSETEKAIQEIRSRSPYQPPKLFTLPVVSMPPPPEPPPTSTPPAADGMPTNIEMLRRRATLKSKRSSKKTP